MDLLKLIKLNIIPMIVMTQIMDVNANPIFPNLKKHMGVYVPAMSKNMEQWSRILKTFFALHIRQEWYKVEIK